MYKILKQLQGDLKQVGLLLNIDLWVTGYISYLDEEVVCFESTERDGVFYSQVIRIDSIIIIDFVSDIRLDNTVKYEFNCQSNFDLNGEEGDDYPTTYFA